LDISADMVKELRQKTGAGVMDCKKALTDAKGNFDNACEIIAQKGLATAKKKSDRTAQQGVIECYVHTGNHLGVMVEINCETDFVARTPEFKGLAHDIALQISAMSPQYICKEDIPADVAKKATAMFLNYPNNPTGACATPEFLNKLVDFARNYDIAICYDNPYSEIVFAGQERVSFLMAKGAKDVGIELNSLSKPFNMCGWRLGMACGNSELIAAISKVKENTDSGIFNPIQFAGIKALQKEAPFIEKMLALYGKRRELVLKTLKKIGIDFNPPRGTFYLWVPVPKGMTSLDFTNRLFDKTSVVVASGTAYGKYGEGFVRISLTVPDNRLQEAMQRIEKEFA